MSEPGSPFCEKRSLIDREQAWQELLAHHREGDEVKGTVHRLKPYGAFVEFLPGQDGLVHRSEILPGQVVEVEQFLWPGDRVRAVIQRIDRERKQVDLSIAALLDGGTQPVAAPPASLPKHEEVRRSYEEFTATPGRISRLLIVDDSGDLRLAFGELLREARFEVMEAEDVAAAQEITRTHPFDLIILDAHTPRADSIEVAAEICQRCPDAHVVLMTGVPLSSEERHRLLPIGVADVLQKPFRSRDLEALLQRLESREEIRWQQADTPPLPVTAVEARSTTGRKQAFREAARDLLEDLRNDTGASAGAIFGMDLVSRQSELLTSVGSPPLAFDQWRRDLDLSPVKDVILEHEDILEKDAAARPGKYKYLLPLLSFRSCIGQRLASAGSRRYALFLFHPSPAAFTPTHRQRARHAATALNALIERYQIEESLRIAAASTLIGQLSAGLAHEVNNRIAALGAQMGLLGRYLEIVDQATERGAPIAADVLSRVGSQARAAQKTVDRLHETALLFQRLASIEQGRSCSVSVVLEHATALLSATARRHKVELRTSELPVLPAVHANEVGLEQVLVNLMLNATQLTGLYRQVGGWVRVEAAVSSNAALPIEVRVSDNGPGIHRRLWSRVFDLGFSTRPGGSGLGLFVARSLVESFGGKVYVAESLMLAGTTFCVALPAAQG